MISPILIIDPSVRPSGRRINIIHEAGVSINTEVNRRIAEEYLGALGITVHCRFLGDCTVEELRIPPDGAVAPILYASMAAQEVDWEACRAAMAYYLRNNFLVVDEDDE